jgi:hypothetical protein
MSSSARHPEPLGPRWRHSSFSTGSDATCVDVAIIGPAVLVRDSKDPAGPVLRFSFAEWAVFLLGVRAREFELPRAPHDRAHRSSDKRDATRS